MLIMKTSCKYLSTLQQAPWRPMWMTDLKEPSFEYYLMRLKRFLANTSEAPVRCTIVTNRLHLSFSNKPNSVVVGSTPIWHMAT
jgi:hypothetical protein